MTTKFWTIKDGVFGTAHINREGNLVDFREGKILSVDRSSQIKNPKIHVLSKDGFDSKIQVDFKIVDSNLDVNDWNQQYASKAKALKIVLIFEGQETNPIDARSLSIDDPNTPIEAVEALKLALKKRLDADVAKHQVANEKKASLASKFETEFDFSSFSRQQRKWIKSFIESNEQKAEQQVEDFIKSREGGSEWLLANRKEVVKKLQSLISVVA